MELKPEYEAMLVRVIQRMRATNDTDSLYATNLLADLRAPDERDKRIAKLERENKNKQDVLWALVEADAKKTDHIAELEARVKELEGGANGRV